MKFSILLLIIVVSLLLLLAMIKNYKFENKNLNILVISSILALFIYLAFFKNPNNFITSDLISSYKSINGLYHDSFNNSIELQSDGKVHFNQLNGNSSSCHTTGQWSDLGNNKINISLEINSNCSFLQRYSGDWEIKNCFNNGDPESGCLVKGQEFYFYKKD
jgi:hypothetical protein